MFLSKRVALAVAGVAVAAVVGTAGVAAATAPDPSPAPPPAPTASSAPDSGRAAPGRAAERRNRIKHRLLGRGLHGEWVVKGRDGQFVTIASIRGEVTAVSATSITVKAEDGFTATYAVTADTKVRGRDVDKIADVKVGDRGAAIGTKSGSTLTARAVLVRK